MVRDKDGRTPLDLAFSDQGLAKVALIHLQHWTTWLAASHSRELELN